MKFGKTIILPAMGCLLLAVAAGACKSDASKENGAKYTVDTASEQPAAQPAYAEVFLATADNQEVKSTDSGLKYIVKSEGSGIAPSATDNVTVHYTGQLLDGTVFDSSYMRGEPATFPLNGVIPGWTEGLQLMNEGAVYVFYIPAELAYGEQGVPGTIPPNSPLIFEVELLKVNK